MSVENNKKVLRTVIEEGFNRGNLTALESLFKPDFIEHQFGLHPGIDGIKRDIQGLRAAFPDLHLTIEDIIAEGEMVWIRMNSRGTNLGPFIGPPTGKSINVTVMDVCRFEDGRIAEHWGVPDRFAILFQLGILPQPTEARA